ncbi:hypothetical protein ACH41E_30935 [Streptomyces sp. NPDC020412]|uniref:hypothetical protein n=1 Tax=Streptomyces sp. NPDC020412 TaxID=3365073 RepID=UPI0037B1BBEA
MSDNTTSSTELRSQYINQVASDLERNTQEQERITAEITALQEQLTTLQHDHTVLVNMQDALGVPAKAKAAESADGGKATVPAPRKRSSAAASSAGKSTKKSSGARTAAKGAATKGAAPKGAAPKGAAPKGAAAKVAAAKGAAKKGAAAKGSTAKNAAQPTLVELIRRHLVEQGEPRSAAEVTAALSKVHPDRNIKATVVRTTLEGLVARNLAHRTKQGTSVFYTTPDATQQQESAAAPEPEGQPEASAQ